MDTNISEDKKTIAVLFGGISPEHEVSVITGLQVLNNSDKSKYNIVPIYVSKEGKWFTGLNLFDVETFSNLEEIPIRSHQVTIDVNSPQYITYKEGLFNKKTNLKIDVAFPCFHGGNGECGAIQGLLDVLEIPYVGSDTLGSSLGMDKVVMKEVLLQNKINVAPYVYFYKIDWKNKQTEKLAECEKKLRYPMFVKPANSGSSIGVTKAKDKKELENAIDVAFSFDRKVIIESGIENFKEINVSIIGISGKNLEVSECEEVIASNDFLNYEDKYVGEGGKSKGMASAKREIPAKISEKSKKLIQETAKKAFNVLNAGGLARIDFLLNEDSGEYYLIEINTIPGSMSFYLWEQTNLSFAKMIDKLINIAFETAEMKTDKTKTFSSNILKNLKSSLKSPKLG